LRIAFSVERIAKKEEERINSYFVKRIESGDRIHESDVGKKKKKCHCEERIKPAPPKAGEAISISYCVLSIALINKKERVTFVSLSN
jgi:hypothetical protein